MKIMIAKSNSLPKRDFSASSRLRPFGSVGEGDLTNAFKTPLRSVQILANNQHRYKNFSKAQSYAQLNFHFNNKKREESVLRTYSLLRRNSLGWSFK